MVTKIQTIFIFCLCIQAWQNVTSSTEGKRNFKTFQDAMSEKSFKLGPIKKIPEEIETVSAVSGIHFLSNEKNESDQCSKLPHYLGDCKLIHKRFSEIVNKISSAVHYCSPDPTTTSDFFTHFSTKKKMSSLFICV